MLLVHLFPPTDLYVVLPQWKKPSERFAIEFISSKWRNILSFSQK